MSRFHRLQVLIGAVAAALGVCAVAQAQTTIGEVARPNPPAVCESSSFDGVPAAAALSTYTVPATGAITSWSTSAAAGAGQELMLKVFHPTGEGPEKYVIAGHDGPRQLTASTVNTFKTALPVQAGDVIGENSVNPAAAHNACEFETANSRDEVLAGESGGDGSPLTVAFGETYVRANVSATFLAAPTISSLSLASGSITGGTSVVVGGSNFSEIKGVSFGSAPAASYVVNSEGQITAVSPAVAAAGSVPISVTTVAGTATSAQQFTYTQPAPIPACTVPKLVGKKLKTAKRKIRAAGCKVGKVGKKKNVTAKSGKVVHQSPKAGRILGAGSQVKVKLG